MPINVAEYDASQKREMGASCEEFWISRRSRAMFDRQPPLHPHRVLRSMLVLTWRYMALAATNVISQLGVSRRVKSASHSPWPLTSPPPLLPLLTPSLTRSSPSRTHASPPTHPRRARICWRVPASTPSPVVQNLIREAMSNSTPPAMWADLQQWPATGYIWALSLPALNSRYSTPLPPVSPASIATSCPFCLPPLDWPRAGSSLHTYLAPTLCPANGSTRHRRRATRLG